MTLADVGELSRKLQEIEVGQPKEALERKNEIVIYRTYLEVTLTLTLILTRTRTRTLTLTLTLTLTPNPNP